MLPMQHGLTDKQEVLFKTKHLSGPPGWLSQLSTQLLISAQVMTQGPGIESPEAALHSAGSQLEDSLPLPFPARTHTISFSN